jgi:large subunit ribosomal protein L1
VQLGTRTPDVAAAVRALRRGRAEYRVDRTSIVHVGVGKVSMPAGHLYANMGALAQSLGGWGHRLCRSSCCSRRGGGLRIGAGGATCLKLGAALLGLLLP